jgi:hypothetical protein
MKKIQLSKILGVHPETARMELELDLAPTKVPDRELIPINLAEKINMAHPLIVVGEDEYYCIGRTVLYRWMAAHMPASTQAFCIEFNKSYSRENIRKQFLIERLIGPSLFQTKPQQVKLLYEFVSKNKSLWPNQYHSYAHLSKMTGVKPIKGIRPNGESR